MIASWMLYTLIISVLTTIAAVAAAHAFEAREWPTRFVWAAALCVSVGWPLVSVVGSLLPKPARPVSVLPFTIYVEAPVTVVSASAERAVLIDRALIATWIVLSLLCAVRILLAVRTVERSRGKWKRQRVDGIRVQISENVGPAVVGLGSMDVVLPAWILSLDESLRAIVLCHEEEHRVARDPLLLFGGAIIAALMPWNAALWYQVRRLRLAVELDCDRRVLRAHPSAERYGMLMLTIAQRRSLAPAMFAPMLTEPTSNLERRILAMKTTKKFARATAYGSGIVAVGTLLFASTLQSAPRSFAYSKLTAPLTQVAQAAERSLLHDTTTVRQLPVVVAKAHASPSVLPSIQQGNQAPHYPDILRSAGIEGTVVARYTTNSLGVPDSSTIEILSSTHALFTNAVLAVLPRWHQAPNTTVETPFNFALMTSVGRSPTGGATVHGVAVGGVLTVTSPPTAVGAAAQPKPVNADQVFFEYQTEKQVTPAKNANNVSPKYPTTLREAKVEGEVLAQFVVDTAGDVVPNTFKVLKSTHDLFTQAVREALPNYKFVPAEVGGRPVKQLVQMPFEFSLSKN